MSGRFWQKLISPWPGRLSRYFLMSTGVVALSLGGCGPPAAAPQGALTPPPQLPTSQAHGSPMPRISAHNAQVALEEVVLLRAIVERVGQITRADALDCSDAALLQSLLGAEPALPGDGGLESWRAEYGRARSGVAQSVERLAVGCAGGDLKTDWYGMAAAQIPHLGSLRESALDSLDIRPQATSVLPQAAAGLYGKPGVLPFAELQASSRVELFYARDERWCLVRPLENRELMGWVECKSLAD
jgi:hypothetical protein